MTNKQWEKYIEEGRNKAAAAMNEEVFNSHTEKEWIKIQDKKIELIEHRKECGYYDNNAEAAVNDWTELYTARIVCYNYANRIE